MRQGIPVFDIALQRDVRGCAGKCEPRVMLCTENGLDMLGGERHAPEDFLRIGPLDLVGELQQQGVQFKNLTDSIDTGTSSERFFFHIMASLTEMERELIVGRTLSGVEGARQLGEQADGTANE